MRFYGKSPMRMLMERLGFMPKLKLNSRPDILRMQWRKAREKFLEWKRRNGHVKMKSKRMRVNHGHGGHEKMIAGKPVTVNARRQVIVKVGKPTRRGVKNSTILANIA